jgi:hypothetical protein
VPTRRSVLESTAYREKAGHERADAYQVSLDGADKSPIGQVYGEEEWLYVGAMIWLVQAYGRAVTGEASVEKGLSDAQGAFDNYRECIIASGSMPEQQDWLGCLREADPSLPEGMFGS